MTKYLHKGLPFVKGQFIDADTYIAGGYDKAPFLFKRTAGGWELVKCLDDGFANFKDFSVKEGDDSAKFFKTKEMESGIKLPKGVRMVERTTKHENFISFVTPFSVSGDTVTELATCDPNGNI